MSRSYNPRRQDRLAVDFPLFSCREARCIPTARHSPYSSERRSVIEQETAGHYTQDVHYALHAFTGRGLLCDESTKEHIHHPRQPRDKDRKRFHCWALVGWNFKSPIYFYDSGNSNSKMTHKAYIEQILEPAVKPLLQMGKDFVLFEEGNSGYGTGKKNTVRKWKEDHGLKNYFNVSNSPIISSWGLITEVFSSKCIVVRIRTNRFASCLPSLA
jgi:hypothetical protein